MQAQGLKRGEDFVDCKSPFVMPCAAWSVARSALRHSRRLQGFPLFLFSPRCCVHVPSMCRELPAPPRPPKCCIRPWSEHRRSSPPLFDCLILPRLTERMRRGCARGFSSHGLPLLSLPPAHVWNAGKPLCLNAVVKFPPLGHSPPPNFADSCIAAELKGNKQAQDIKAGVGSLGGLKKSL